MIMNEYHPNNVQSYLHIKRKQLREIARYTRKKVVKNLWGNKKEENKSENPD